LKKRCRNFSVTVELQWKKPLCPWELAITVVTSSQEEATEFSKQVSDPVQGMTNTFLGTLNGVLL